MITGARATVHRKDREVGARDVPTIKTRTTGEIWNV
jgi:hypothetical protein